MLVVALVGLSGVGKSTLLGEIARSVPFCHFQASNLIKAERARSTSRETSSEELRLGPVLDNQALLISSFTRATRDVVGLVVFDGHIIIDGLFGLTEIRQKSSGRYEWTTSFS